MKNFLRRYTFLVGLLALATLLFTLKLLFAPQESGRGFISLPSPSPSPDQHRTELFSPEDRQLREEGVRPGIEYRKKNPLIAKLPHQENTFILDHRASDNTYIVHMLLRGKKTVDEEIKQSKQDALDWIRAQGVNPDILTIEYITS